MLSNYKMDKIEKMERIRPAFRIDLPNLGDGPVGRLASTKDFPKPQPQRSELLTLSGFPGSEFSVTPSKSI